MQKADQSATVDDGLLEPDHGFVRSGAFVPLVAAVLGIAVLRPGFGHGDCGQEGENGMGNEG